MKYDEILEQFQALVRPAAIEGAAQIGIAPKTTLLGVALPKLHKMAVRIGVNHALAEQLWASNIHEGRILATMIADPAQITEKQMEDWAADFDSWDLCDQCCKNLFAKTRFAYDKIETWSQRDEALVKRAAFALMAVLADDDQTVDDSRFSAFLPLIEAGAGDKRECVRKAVAWALRQIGKRNRLLNQEAVESAKSLQKSKSKSAQWVAENALDELTKADVQRKLRES